MPPPTAPLRALVTGGSRGIGRCIARLLAARGCQVALQYRANERAAASALEELDGNGHATFSADLGRPDAVAGLWREVADRFGGLDLLINNAGIYEQHAPLETTLADWTTAWETTLAVNLHAPAHLSHLAANWMARAPERADFGRGRIVNISSRGAFRGEPDAPAYGASKAGLNSLGQSLAKALAPRRVYVYSLAPGWVETEMAAGHLAGDAGAEIKAQHPLGRVTQPDEVARVAVFCALDAPAAMTGAILDVNGASYLRT